MLVKVFVKLTESEQQVHLQLLLHLEFSVSFYTCHIASAHFADLGGTSSSFGPGTPHPRSGWGGIWDVWTWDGVTPLPHPNLRWGTLLRKCGQTETITFPHPLDVGGNNNEIVEKE